MLEFVDRRNRLVGFQSMKSHNPQLIRVQLQYYCFESKIAPVSLLNFVFVKTLDGYALRRHLTGSINATPAHPAERFARISHHVSRFTVNYEYYMVVLARGASFHT